MGWLTGASEEDELRKMALKAIYDHSLCIKLGVHSFSDRDSLYNLIIQSSVLHPRKIGSRVFVSPDYNEPMEQQREVTMKRMHHLVDHGVFRGWITEGGAAVELRRMALNEVVQMYDHSLAVMLGAHYFLWGGAIQFFGTKRHHDNWLKITEEYGMKGCFAMTELGHGSNVRGIETVTTYDPNAKEFIINTPCESAQKYKIGGAAKHATHIIVFSQLHINGKDEGVHAFIVQIRDEDNNVCPNIRIADCGHKIGLNGNLLNSVADVSPDGQYLSAIKDPVQRFAAFLAPLTSGRVNIAVCSIYIAKVGLATALRYALSRRAFSLAPNEPEVLLLDYPSHQRRLLPLLGTTYAISLAGNYLKSIYVKRSPVTNKTIHVVSSALKAMLTWHSMRTLQECHEACGGQGLKTENRVGHLKGEYDVLLTFEGDNNVLMQQVIKALFGEYLATEKQNRPFKGLWLEHMNGPSPVIPAQLTGSILRSSQIQAYQLAEDLGRAFADKTILLTSIEAEANVAAGPLKDVLALLRTLYALVVLEEDASFLRYGYLSVENAAVVRKEVMKLCSELRPHTLALVSSFGIPDAFLSPIAFDWIDANSWSSVQQ
uniref:Acyl-coenzyme A oxidase n=1 Tax=Chenopodium quinoa TaxID=63459 RepID=A0A803MW07_CHEQI